MNFKYIVLLILSNFFITSKAYIQQMDMYDKIFCFGDIHFGSLPGFEHPYLKNEQIAKINCDQANAIVSAIKKIDTNDCIVLIEDVFDYSKDNEINNLFFNLRNSSLKKNYSSCLDFIHSLCKIHNIPIINIEFRQPFSLFFCRAIITAEIFLEHLNELKNEILNYNDLPKLNNYYEQSINNIFKKNASFINLLKNNKDKLMTEFMFKDESYTELMNNFFEDYHKLFDVKLIHNIYKLIKLNKNIFVVVGNLHIKRLKDRLNIIGYKGSLYHKSSSAPQKPLIFKVVTEPLKPNLEILDASRLFLNFILIIVVFATAGIIRELIFIQICIRNNSQENTN